MKSFGRTGIVLWTLVTAFLLVTAAAALFAFSGTYDVAADKPHTPVVLLVLGAARAHSIAAHAQDIVVPGDLNDPKRVAAGAAEYGEMCSQCHLAPAMERTEISQGLYPAALELYRGDRLTEAEQFWVIKHGIKFTAMPAWGLTHDDNLIWNIVAFVHKLPSLSAARYKVMTANEAEEHEHMMQNMPMTEPRHP